MNGIIALPIMVKQIECPRRFGSPVYKLIY